MFQSLLTPKIIEPDYELDQNELYYSHKQRASVITVYMLSHEPFIRHKFIGDCDKLSDFWDYFLSWAGSRDNSDCHIFCFYQADDGKCVYIVRDEITGINISERYLDPNKY